MHWGHDDDDGGSGGELLPPVWEPVYNVTDAVPQAKAAVNQLRGKWVMKRQHERRPVEWTPYWWCCHCQRAYRWSDLQVGLKKVSIPGTLRWSMQGWELCCPNPDCTLGHGFEDLLDYQQLRELYPDWPAEPEQGQYLPVTSAPPI
jgi:hypothetical protein